MKLSKKAILMSASIATTLVLSACGNGDENNESSSERPEDAPDTWIADRTITGLVFQSPDDVGADTMSPEIAEYIKERTGITLELQGITSEDSQEALAAGLAAGDLPDFTAFYLNNSGRPEFSMLLQAANEGMFHDVAPFLKDSEGYGRYWEEGYLPRDTRENIMMRDDHDGATYLVHMSINEEPADPGMKSVGGMYVRKDIADELGVDPLEINTSEEFAEFLQQVADGGFTDDAGNPVTPLGPTVWGGSERPWPYQDLTWEGDGGEKFWKDGDTILHESQTDYGEQRVEFVRNLLDNGLMHAEYYTMEENRAKEGVINGSFAVVGDMYSYTPENADMTYVPLGPINRVDGNNHMVMPYKSGYAGWAIPSTTENPEEVAAFASWMASPEGKLLYQYGLEGEHYELDENDQPVVKEELIQLREENPDEAIKEGFRGVRAYWGEHLSWTNMNNVDHFGEENWGERQGEVGDNQSTAQKIAEYWNYDERYEDKEVIDGLTPRSYVYEFEDETGNDLTAAMDSWDESIVQAYYAKTDEEAKEIIEFARQGLVNNGIEEFSKFLEEKEAEGEVIYY